MRTVLALVLCGGALGQVGAACASPKNEAQPDAEAEASAPLDAGAPDGEESAAEDAGRGAATQLGAMAQTSVLDSPAWPESNTGSKRLGYLRHGAIVSAYDRPTPNGDCKDGWYELVQGGWVCGKAVTVEVTSPRVRLAPKQPDRDAGMPYRYGVNLTDGTPLYRKALSTEERKKYEPWLVPAKPTEEDDKGEKSEKSEKAEGDVEEQAPIARTAPVDAGAPPPKPTLKELKGKGVLVRKMAKGFYLALDKEFRSSGARWWRTSFGFAVPHERLMLQTGVTKHAGTWFGEGALADLLSVDDADAGDVVVDAGDGGAASLAGAVAFVTVGFARKLELSDDRKKLTWGAELPKRAAVMLTGRDAVVSGQTYHQTTGGFWVRLMDLKLAKIAPPADLAPNEKWIDVDLTRQALVALEGTRPVFATLIASGKRNPQDKERDFPTPTGTFRIREKHVTTTMDGDVASDGPYSIEDVPWVMYFQGSYALHGAFWHDQFGRMRSHGCVNMAPDDARTLFGWAEPALPEGWHGVFSKDDASGTRIVVHEDGKR
ncbi:MAG: L,D-transpeptidase [Labilithrix sp.]|nr:L,D-transpeptidase [Labilithrix sp.]